MPLMAICGRLEYTAAAKLTVIFYCPMHGRQHWRLRWGKSMRGKSAPCWSTYTTAASEFGKFLYGSVGRGWLVMPQSPPRALNFCFSMPQPTDLMEPNHFQAFFIYRYLRCCDYTTCHVNMLNRRLNILSLPYPECLSSISCPRHCCAMSCDAKFSSPAPPFKYNIMARTKCAKPTLSRLRFLGNLAQSMGPDMGKFCDFTSRNHL